MPTVPLANDNQVRANPLSGERFDAPDIGAGGRMMGRAMQGLAQDFDDIDTMLAEARAKKAEAEYQTYERERLLGEGGFYTTRSADTLAAQKTTSEDLRKKRAELLARAAGKERAMLEGVLTRRGQEAEDGIARYSIGQAREFRIESIDARISASAESYATYLNTDPERAQGELDTIHSEFAQLADTQGWNDPDILTQQREKILGSVHSTYIQAEMERDPARAAAYLEKYRGEIAHADEVRLDAQLSPLLVEADADTALGVVSTAVSDMPVIANDPEDAPGTQAVVTTSRQVFRAMVGDKSPGAGRFRGAEGGTDSRTGRFLTSPAGAIGPAQVMPGTAREMAAELGIKFDEKRYKSDFGYNMMLGEAYFNKMLRTFGGDVAKAVAAYNAGPGGVNRAVRKGGASWRNFLPDETKRYLVTVLGNRTAGAAMAPSTREQARSSESAEVELAETYIAERFADKPPLHVKRVMARAKAKIREKWQTHRAEQNAEEQAAWDAVNESVANQGGWDAITSTRQVPGFRDLPGDKRNQVLNVVNANLEARATEAAARETDYAAYDRYLSMPLTELKKVPIPELQSRLSNEKLGEIIKRRNSGQLDQGKAWSTNRIVTTTRSLLAEAGLPTGDSREARKAAPQVNAFARRMYQWAEGVKREGGKWPDEATIQRQADRFLIEGTWEGGEGKLFEAPSGASVKFDIPRATRDTIVRALSSGGRRPTEKEIGAAYIRGKGIDW